ncbi:MAG: GNAT family N-acetyltransferase [Chloroflexota bacterium]
MNATATRARSTARGHTGAQRRPAVSIRPIEASDADDLAAFYAALTDESRRTRFFCSSRGISMDQARAFAAVDHRTADGFVAVLRTAGRDDGRIVGHICLEPNGDRTDEVAVAVADAVQGQGIGTRLMRAAVTSAAVRGLSGVTASLLCGNVPMRRLLMAAGLPIVPAGHDGAVASFVLPVSTATPVR